MAVGVIIITVVSMFAVIIAWTALAPVSQELGTDIGDAWEDNKCNNNTTRPECVARDTAFQAYLVLPLFTVLAIAGWMFLTLTRRDFGQT